MSVGNGVADCSLDLNVVDPFVRLGSVLHGEATAEVCSAASRSEIWAVTRFVGCGLDVSTSA